MRPLSLLAALVVCTTALAAEPDKDGFVPMWNGKDLTGWVNVNTAPGTFFVKDDMIVTTGHPTGYLRTNKQYENFVAEFDWMHIPPKPGAVGNSGFFVWADPVPAVGTGYTRGIEVQVLVNLTYKNKKGDITATSQGDLFSIWGATCVPDRPHPDGWARCLPKENHCKGENEWNHYRVEGKDGRITLAVNGHEVSGVSKCSPRKGYLALESEGSECRFKNLKIKELPTSNPRPEEIANEDNGLRSAFDGLDLHGWKTADKSWKAAGGHLSAAGRALLVSDRKYTTGELVFDWKLPAKSSEDVAASLGGATVMVNAAGRVKVGVVVLDKLSTETGTTKAVKPGAWNRTVLTFDGKTATVRVNGEVVAKVAATQTPSPGPLLFHPAEGLEVMNLFVRERKEK